ncbi:DUF72 domain-containing protein [Gelidibacter salicanalis]|uniref:DUF72 domain-containing protein n=1 Tax=Gelidibacter salicanalis TaxID=291193 RepID=A0A934NIY1_9FLAO|nr:DUF72 domain-containing protein [Gelidibacter salicanalis]MBJ7880634.1 DUF72 domain-containing protein [Gelidibacter salicanalis]
MAMSAVNNLFYSGTSGVVLPVNKSQFPAEFQNKSRLQYYASLFNSVEINSTFYKLPKPTTVLNWAADVPEGFRFTFKISKSITHAPGLAFAVKDVVNFMDVVGNIGTKKGCLLAQFPPSLTIHNLDQLVKLLEIIGEIGQNQPWNICLEFRNSSWSHPQVSKLLLKHNTTIVLHDLSEPSLQWHQIKSNIVYLRFHGPDPRYRGNYSDKFLMEHAQYIKQWIGEEKMVYAYFNNTMGNAFNNLQDLNEKVR